ncbi:MAG: cysteine desulfurase [Planctomycetaceae bacterium]
MPIYLDNAATSFPKPETVYAAIDHYNRIVGAPGGRGAYGAATECQATLNRCRKQVSDLLGVGSPDHVVMTFNCTDSLNTVLHGLLQPGDHVVTTQIEHNSILRPLQQLKSAGVETTIVEVGDDHLIDPSAIRNALRPGTRLVATLHASNVTGTIQPIADIGQIAQDHGALMLVDAAQTAGQYPIDMRNVPVDFLAAAGHKSLLGPLGTGVLCIREGAEEQLRSFRQGGTGSASESDVQPAVLPDRFESGNLNMPGIYGLAAGLDFIAETGLQEIVSRKQRLTSRLVEGLASINGVTVFGSPEVNAAAVVSFTIDGFEPQDAATILDQSFDIQCRAGLHCAPGAHQAIGTRDSGGTVRFGAGFFTTEDDIDAALEAVKQLASA